MGKILKNLTFYIKVLKIKFESNNRINFNELCQIKCLNYVFINLILDDYKKNSKTTDLEMSTLKTNYYLKAKYISE